MLGKHSLGNAANNVATSTADAFERIAMMIHPSAAMEQSVEKDAASSARIRS